MEQLARRTWLRWLPALMLLTALAAALPSAWAAPASPFAFTIDQPNGARVTVVRRGDEFQGWLETAEGYTIVLNPVSGFYEYAQAGAGGELLPSGVAADNQARGASAPPLTGLRQGLRPARNAELEAYSRQFLERAAQQRQRSVSAVGGPRLATWDPVPVTGARKVLVILVSFLDSTISSGGASYWGNTAFNTTTKSVAKYFADNSYGLVSVAPVAHTQAGNPAGVVSVSLASNHPNCSLSCSYTTESSWINAALQSAASFVNFAALDTNGDGRIAIEETLVYFVLAGYEAASTNLTPSIWAHAWGGPNVGVAGKVIDHWALNGERYSATELMRMGTMAHEVGHAMGGLPDLYDISGTNGGLGYFSLMSSGNWLSKAGEVPGTTPAGLDAWSRLYLGWSTPRVPSNGATLSLGSGQSSSSSAVILRNTALSAGEYWLVENRTPVNWDEGLTAALGTAWTGGLLIQHIDLNVGTKFGNSFNEFVSGGHQGNMAEEPSTALCSLRNSQSAGCRTILFYSGNATAFGPSTTPNSSFYTGAASAFSVTGISAPATTMSATFGTGGATGGPEFMFSSATASVTEGANGNSLVVTRTSSTTAATVNYATANGSAIAGTDYTARSGTLSFAAGVASAAIVIPITNDTAPESSETFTVSLSSPSVGSVGTPGTITVTIVDNDVAASLSFGAASYSVTEGTASISIPVTRSSTAGTASVSYATANGSALAGSDYTARSGTLSFAAGVGTANITVPITNDTLIESSETFSVSLSNPVGASLGAITATTVTIVDNDTGATVSFGSAAYSVTEGTASLVIPVARSNAVGSASVRYATSNGTATAGSDYTARSGTLSFASGVSSANIVVPITNDATVEGDETFNVTLSSPVSLSLGATPQTTVTIVNNGAGPPSVSLGSATYSVTEGTASISIPVTRSSTVGSSSVRYATANGSATAGSDYTARSGTLSFASGASSATIVVPITNDTAAESAETFTVTLSSPVSAVLGAISSATVTLVDNDSTATTKLLTVYRQGQGGVSSTPSGISCYPGNACSASFPTSSSVTLVATPATGWAFSRWQGACSTTASSCTVSMSSAMAAVAVFTSTAGLGAALDNTTLPWSTFGHASWGVQTGQWVAGGSALQSGVVTHLQSTTVQTVVTGPGLLTFRWKVSSEANYDNLTFQFDGWAQWYMSGESGWQQQSWFIPDGSHVVSWVYAKDGSVDSGSNAGWLDEVSFTPGTNFSSGLARVPVVGQTAPTRQLFGPVLAKP